MKAIDKPIWKNGVRELKYFIKELLNFTEAARILIISQSTTGGRPAAILFVRIPVTFNPENQAKAFN